jgi:hypothetical protein
VHHSDSNGARSGGRIELTLMKSLDSRGVWGKLEIDGSSRKALLPTHIKQRRHQSIQMYVRSMSCDTMPCHASHVWFQSSVTIGPRSRAHVRVHLMYNSGEEDDHKISAERRIGRSEATKVAMHAAWAIDDHKRNSLEQLKKSDLDSAAVCHH